MPINFGNSRNSRIRNQQDVYQEERNAFDLLKLDIKQQDDALVKEIKANEQNFSDLATQLQDGNITQEELLGVRKSLGILEKEQGLSPFKDDSLLSAVNKRYISRNPLYLNIWIMIKALTQQKQIKCIIKNFTTKDEY